MQEVTKVSTHDQRRLTTVEFQTLARVSAAVEWFANLDNPQTRRVYQNDLEHFCGFVGLLVWRRPMSFAWSHDRMF